MNTFTVGAAMLAALVRQARPIPPEREDLVDTADTQAVARFLIARAAGLHPRTLGDRARLRAYVVGQLSSQLLLQQPLAVKQVLAMKLLGWEQHGGPGHASLISLPAEYAHVDTDLIVASLVLAHGRKNIYFNLPASLRTMDTRYMSHAAAQGFFDRTQIEIGDVARVVGIELRGSDGVDTRTVAFWTRHPFVHLGSGHYLLCPTGMLMDALVLGVVLRAMEAERAKVGTESTPLAQEFGRRFERHVGSILALNARAGLVHPEVVFMRHRGGEYKTSDFTVSTSRGDVLLLEVKLRGFKREVFAGEHLAAFHTAIDEVLLPPLLQAIRALFHMERGAGPVLPDARLVCEETRRASRLTIVIVLPYFPTSLNCGQVHECVEAALWKGLAKIETEKSSLRGLSAWARQFLGSRDVAWAWVEVADLEQYAGWISSPDLPSLLGDFARDARRQPSVMPEAQQLAPSLNDWMRTKGAKGELHVATRTLAGQFWRAIALRAYGKDIGDEGRPERPGEDSA